MFHRMTNESKAGDIASESNLPLRQHSMTKNLLKASSFKGFLLLSIAVSVNFMVVSTLLVNQEHRRTSTVVADTLIKESYVSNRIQQSSRPSSSTHEDSSLPMRKTEPTNATITSVVEDELQRPIKTTLDRVSSSTVKNEGALISSNSLSTTTISTTGNAISSSLPYYLWGKTRYKLQKFHRKKTFQRIKDEIAKPVKPSQKVWVLQDPVKIPTRNHESVLLEYETTSDKAGDQQDDRDKQILVNILGRYSRGVQWMDLKTGEQRFVETHGTDPDKRPLNDLNHVASVVVDSLEPDNDGRRRKEVWLPCGFHNDRVGKEKSSNYARIVDLETMEVRTGPKLPYSGGACGAAPIQAIAGEPPLVCAFGGTNGNHDTGIFLPYVSCYDRVVEKWVYPFGKLPVGMDHLSVVIVPKDACHSGDPARVLVFNFRTKNYATHTSAEILAFDIPENGWTREELDNASADQHGRWYTFANHTFDGGKDEAYAPRDASGVVMADGGRSVVNFGGINQVPNPLFKKKEKGTGPKVFSTWYSTVRVLDVCAKDWKKVGNLGIETFALMASASTKLNTAFFCGGSMSTHDFHGNTELCLAIRIPGIQFWNHRTSATENFPDGFEAGGKVGTNEAAVKTADGIETVPKPS